MAQREDLKGRSLRERVAELSTEMVHVCGSEDAVKNEETEGSGEVVKSEKGRSCNDECDEAAKVTWPLSSTFTRALMRRLV